MSENETVEKQIIESPAPTPEKKADTSKNKVVKKAQGLGKKFAKDSAQLANAYFNAPVPSSLNWLYGLGFKIGLLLILKSFIILRYQYSNLSSGGIYMLSAQCIMAIIMIANGILLQSTDNLHNARKLYIYNLLYLVLTVPAIITSILAETENWSFFTRSSTNFLKNILIGIKEFQLDLLFIDRDLCIALVILMFIITLIYMMGEFGPLSILGRYKTIDEEGNATTKHSILVLFLTVLLIGGSTVAVFNAPKLYHIGKIQIEYSSSDLCKKSEKDLISYLQMKGLKDFTIIASKGSAKRDGTVQSITIGEDAKFAAQLWFSKSCSVIIECLKDYGALDDKVNIKTDETLQLAYPPVSYSQSEWVSSDPSIVTVSDSGLLTPQAEGEAEIKLYLDNYVYTITINVKKKASIWPFN